VRRESVVLIRLCVVSAVRLSCLYLRLALLCWLVLICTIEIFSRLCCEFCVLSLKKLAPFLDCASFGFIGLWLLGFVSKDPESSLYWIGMTETLCCYLDDLELGHD